MTDWCVKGVGAEVTVTSPAGDEYPFVITDIADLHLQLGTRPRWGAGREPPDADRRIGAALAVASRWTEDTFGPPTRDGAPDPRSAARPGDAVSGLSAGCQDQSFGAAAAEAALAGLAAKKV